MHGIRRRVAVRALGAVAIAVLAFTGALSTPPATQAGLARWTGGIDLYRSGVFTTQKTWQWCTAADVQIIRNIVDRQADHSRANQARYFDAMRAHNRYTIPVSDGVDPAGWAYGLHHFVDARYRLVSSGSFDAALRSAVTNLRRTNLPVGITVAHGSHAWVLTGFTATADPATTTHFTVTSVRVVGPLWGLQSRTYGYDMRPDTKLTRAQLAGFFTPWHYARIRMAWEDRWVSIQPIAAAAAPAAPAPSASASARPSAPASIAPSAVAAPSAAFAPSEAASPSSAPSPTAIAAAAPLGSDNGATAAAGPTSDAGPSPGGALLAAGLAALGIGVLTARWRGRGRSRARRGPKAIAAR